jgi:signal transduction histidine kinase
VARAYFGPVSSSTVPPVVLASSTHNSVCEASCSVDDENEVDVRVSNTEGVPEALRAAPPPRSGFGLLGMRERVMLSGGTLSVGPTPEGGFLVAAGFPKESR